MAWEISVISSTNTMPWCAIGFVLLISVYFLLLRPVRLDRREPPMIYPKIPLIGHSIGLFWYGGRYFRDLGCEHQHLPIFTLPTGAKSRMYVVTSPALALAVQKSKRLSFNAAVPELTKRVLGLNKETVEIVKQNANGEKGSHGFIQELHNTVRPLYCFFTSCPQ
jgi:hypothetical protein